MKKSNLKWWIVWLLVTLSICAYNAYALLGPDKTIYVGGETTHGHYQIEMSCDSCHGEAFSDEEVMQKSCVRCHSEELEAVDDSHPRKKFTDPRNADRVAILDARYCVTCHIEHKPEVTREMAVTLADDFCVYCHEDVAEDRESHKDLAFNGCSAAGCHNYHDNSALYEDFLVKHANEPATSEVAVVPTKNYTEWLELVDETERVSLSRENANSQHATNSMKFSELVEWEESGHAQQGVNCMGCHKSTNDSGQEWLAKPDYQACNQCHKQEVKGFQMGKHGMRTAVDLPAMQPGLARLPMKEDSIDRHLGCSSCHSGHTFDTRRAAVEACLTCHNDEHSLAYKASPHYQLWQEASSGKGETNSGVSCATCHMPREEIREKGEKRIAVQHNQNMNLKPNEKMMRSVCMHCHGYEFAMNALADEALIQKNFNGGPTVNIESAEWAVKRELLKQQGKVKKDS